MYQGKLIVLLSPTKQQPGRNSGSVVTLYSVLFLLFCLLYDCVNNSAPFISCHCTECQRPIGV